MRKFVQMREELYDLYVVVLGHSDVESIAQSNTKA